MTKEQSVSILLRSTPELPIWKVPASKAQILGELKRDYKDKLDIKPLIRECISCLGKKSTKLFASRIDPEIDKWEQWIGDVVAKSKFGPNPVVAHFDDFGKLVEEFRVSNDWPKRLRMLLRRNMHTSHYDKHYISGDVVPPTVGSYGK